MIRSWPSVIFGCICVIGTIIVLFGHVRSIDDLTLTHLYIALALTVTLGAGHFMWSTDSVLIAAAFGILFVTGTIVCVGLSGGRSAAILEQKERVAKDIRKMRADQWRIVEDAKAKADRALQDSTDADAEADAAKIEMDRECATGKGIRCDGRKLSYDEAKNKAEQLHKRALILEERYRIELDKYHAMPPEPVPNEDLISFARIWAHIKGTSEDVAMHEIKLFLPYGFALLTEFGTIMFFRHGFGHRTQHQRLVTLAELSYDLGLHPKTVRKMLRVMNVPKPAAGWQWPEDQANAIAQRILRQRTGAEVRH